MLTFFVDNKKSLFVCFFIIGYTAKCQITNFIKIKKMKKKLSREEGMTSITLSGFKITLMEGFDPTIINVIEGFQKSVKDRSEYDLDYYTKDVGELISLEEPFELFEYITEDDYWVKYFTSYLLDYLVHNFPPDIELTEHLLSRHNFPSDRKLTVYLLSRLIYNYYVE